MHRRQNFQKTGQKSFFDYYLENVDQKSRFFGARSPVKFSIYCLQRRLYKVFRVCHQKLISQICTNWYLRVRWGSNPWEGRRLYTPPPLNPSLIKAIQIYLRLLQKIFSLRHTFHFKGLNFLVSIKWAHFWAGKNPENKMPTCIFKY